ncbi:MAG: UMP kinase [Verrucomicrobiales bacterium]|nr:UMP kinase [Verrucomicrobiales bacterium]
MPREFKRVVLKLSGEALREQGGHDNISPEIVEDIAKQIKSGVDRGLEIALVVGGGNFWRGASAAGRGMDRSTADHVGMLATVMNSLALMGGLEALGVETRVLTAIEMKEVAEPFILRRALRHLERGRVVIFGAGTGNPFFSTDSTASLRANEISADLIFKGTKVDGVYDKDPVSNDDARRYANVNFQDCLQFNLGVMDSNAFALCSDNNLPIVVFDMMTPGNIERVLSGEDMGTLVSSAPTTFA